MELISLNDKLSIPINQDNCSAAEGKQWETLNRHQISNKVSWYMGLDKIVLG